jgi:hypothetical protein
MIPQQPPTMANAKQQVERLLRCASLAAHNGWKATEEEALAKAIEIEALAKAGALPEGLPPSMNTRRPQAASGQDPISAPGPQLDTWSILYLALTGLKPGPSTSRSIKVPHPIQNRFYWLKPNGQVLWGEHLRHSLRLTPQERERLLAKGKALAGPPPEAAVLTLSLLKGAFRD